MTRCTHIYLALPAPADGGARPGLPFLERVGGARFDEVPAVAGKVAVEMGAVMETFSLLRLELSLSTSMSSSLMAGIVGSMVTGVADPFVAARLLGRCTANRSEYI
jgi:hypothetical protein